MKTVVIGAGRMGLRHVEVVRSLGPTIGLELVGLADMNPQSLAAAAEAAGDQRVDPSLHFTDAEAMLKATAPQCVIIATTAPGHAPLTCLAAEHGATHILCEKPIATSLADADRMIAACRKHGAKLAINHQMRFMEQYTLPRQIAQSEALGGLASVNVVAGNFGMAMNGTHYIEMFRYMTQPPKGGEDAAPLPHAPTHAQAWFSDETVPNPRGPQFEDRAGCIRLTNANGQRFYMDVSSDHGHGMHVTYAGPRGRITIDELTGHMTVVTRKPEHREAPTTRYGMPWDEATQQITPADAVAPTRAVLESLLRGEDYPTGEQARDAVAALVAGYVSNETGHAEVAIDDALPADRVFPWA